MAAPLPFDALEQKIRSGEIDTVLVCMVDMQGRLIGKRVTGHFFLSNAVDEVHACDYLLALDMEMEPVPGFAAASWGKGYGDLAIHCDLDTLRLIPWLEATALVLGDVVDQHGEDLPHSPRAILRRQIERLSERGWVAKMGSELELYLFDETYEAARDKRYHDLKTAGWYIEDYHIFQSTKEESVMRAIRNGMDGAGIPVEFSKGEFGPGQQEINLVYAEALEMADRHSIYKNGAKEIAWQRGKALSFMAKIDIINAGNSCHIHSSLWDAADDQALFHDPAHEHGMSKLFKHYLAGQLACAREMTYFLAPTINSYKRFQAASFAPTKAVWAVDNRTAGFRVCGHGPGTRIECRVPGGDVNPYLAYAALIAAGLHGIDQELELESAYSGDAYAGEDLREVPKTLRDAVAELDRSSVMRAALGDAVVDHYVHAGTWEQTEYDRHVTDWELIRYFERV